MKKLISIVLCMMMISSLVAMNVSASVVMRANQVDLVNDDFEGLASAEEIIFAGAQLGEDAEGSYIYSDKYARPRFQSENFPENGSYTIEFDSKFSSTEDGSAQMISVFVLDHKLVEAINSSDVTTSLDFEIRGDVDMEAKGIDKDKWYSFRIIFDTSKGITFNSGWGRVLGDGIVLQWKERGAAEWKTAMTKVGAMDLTGENLWYEVDRDYWKYINSSDMETPGFAFQTRTFLDNLKISYADPIPSTGVLYSDDFEGATNLKSGIASVEYKDGNGYLALKGAGSNWTGSGYATATQIPENFILTMDIYKEADCENPLVFEYWQSNVNETGVWGQVGINAADVEANKWYTLKIAKIAAGRTYIATVENKETGEVTEVVPRNNVQGITSYHPGEFMFRGWSGSGVINWKVDNFILTEATAASLPVINAADDAVELTVSADAISETITPILALYNGGRLVDIDWDTKDNATDGVSAELAAAGSYDAAKIFVWDSFDTATPLMAMPWDITEIIVK